VLVLLRRVPPRPNEWLFWAYWIAAGAAAIKLGYDRWPWFSSSPVEKGRMHTTTTTTTTTTVAAARAAIPGQHRQDQVLGECSSHDDIAKEK